MTTQAKLADGTVLNFPDGTPQEVIQGVVKQHLSGAGASSQSQARSAGDEITRQLGLTGRYLLEGASTPVAIVGDAANGLANLGISGINAVAGTNIPKFQSYEQYRDKALDVLPKPENAKERVVGDMSRFIAAAGGTAGAAKVGEMAGTRALAPLGENMAGQALAAEAGGGAFGITGEHTDNPWLKGAAALLGGAGGAGIAAATERFAPSAVPRPAVPTTQQIREASNAAYRDAGEAGAILTPAPLQRVNTEFTNWLANFGYDPALQPHIGVLLNRLQGAGQNNITAEGVDIIRKIAGNVARDGNPSERTIAGELVGRLDDMMDNLNQGDVVQGNGPQAAQAFSRARELWRTYRKSELLDNLLVKGEDQALSTNSGGNVQNAIRQKLRSILDNPRTSRLFTEEERTAIRQVVRGTPTQNALRIVGRLAPSSNSWLPIILGGGPGGYAAGGLPGTAAALGIPAAGSLAKAGATALTRGAVNRLSNTVRSTAIPAQPEQAPAFDPQQMLIQSLLQGTRPQPLNAYADALLRSGGAAVPASGNQDTGPRPRP